jgi:hypothetical protein
MSRRTLLLLETHARLDKPIAGATLQDFLLLALVPLI